MFNICIIYILKKCILKEVHEIFRLKVHIRVWKIPHQFSLFLLRSQLIQLFKQKEFFRFSSKHTMFALNKRWLASTWSKWRSIFQRNIWISFTIVFSRTKSFFLRERVFDVYYSLGHLGSRWSLGSRAWGNKSRTHWS